MGIPINIKSILNQDIVESARIEFKENWNPESILHTICAFANDIDNWGGGYIVVGVKEKDGRPSIPITGIEKNSVDKTMKDLLRICNFIEPRYIPVCEPVIFDGKQLILIWAPGGYSRPYKCPVKLSLKHPNKIFYIRKLSNTIKANSIDEKELIELINNIPFDDRVNIVSDIYDLKISYIRDYLYDINSNLYVNCENKSIEELALDLKIAGGPAEYFKPRNVGLMFFNTEPQDFFSYSRIELVNIPDPTGMGMIEKQFIGPLHIQLRDALLYIKNNIVEEKIIKNKNEAEAVRIFNYPYIAIEEILCNAIYHKSYQIAEPITIRITNDDIEIYSCPGPDRSISDENLANCNLRARRYRNRRIGDFLKELRLIEGRNTGIPTVLKALKDNGSSMPIFETDKERSYFSVKICIHPIFNEGIELRDNDIPIINQKKRRTRLEIEREVLKTLKTGEYSTNEVSAKLGYKGISKTFSEVINKLIKMKIIEYTISDIQNSPLQKLRLVLKK